MPCKKIIIPLTAVLMCLNTSNAHAASCVTKAMEKKAENIKITSKFNHETKTYDVTVAGLTSNDIYIYCQDHPDYQFRYTDMEYDERTQSYTYQTKEETKYKVIDRDKQTITITGVPSGSYQFFVSAFTTGCSDDIKPIAITLDKYNTYADDKRCAGVNIDEVPVCDPWYDGTIDESLFTKKINEHNSSNTEEPSNTNNTTNEETKKDNSSKAVSDFISQNYLVIIIGIIAIVAVSYIVQAIIKRRKKPGDLL